MGGTSGVGRRAFLTAGALGLAVPLVTAATAPSAAAAPPSLTRPPVVFYSPHADDETLSLGVDVVSELLGGRDVVVVLMTQGCSEYMLGLLNGDCWDPVALVQHSPEAEGYLGPLVDGRLTAEIVAAARVQEWRSACGALGAVRPGRLSTLVAGLPEGLTVDQVRPVVTELEGRHPGASHRTLSWTDPHPDHAACGQALRDLHAEGALSDVRYCVQRGHEHLPTAFGVPSWPLPVSARTADAVRRAAESYRVWNPSAGWYGFGYRSVQPSFDALLASPAGTAHA